MSDLAMLRQWDTEPHVVAADPDSDWMWELELNRDPDWRRQLIAQVDGRAIGFVQIIDPQLEDEHYWGDRGPGLRAIDIWIGPPDALGRGYGTEMMTQAIELCFSDHDVTAILIDPLEGNRRARKFYERLGFRHQYDRWFGSDRCAVYRLERADRPSVDRASHP